MFSKYASHYIYQMVAEKLGTDIDPQKVKQRTSYVTPSALSVALAHVIYRLVKSSRLSTTAYLLSARFRCLPACLVAVQKDDA
jgi:hypothetical protein